jgi:large subunit ribosomal protein L30
MAVKKQKKKNKSYPQIKIKLTRSLIGRNQKQRAIIKGLGLGKVDSHVIRQKRPEILGMIKKVDFMLEVNDI